MTETPIYTTGNHPMLRGKRKNWPVEILDLPEKPGVYVITCNVTGEQYVGGTQNIRKRACQHFQQAGLEHRVEWMPPVTRCIFEHGPQSFGVKTLETCSLKKVPSREVHWFLQLNPSLNAYAPNGRSHWRNA